jgi:DNA-binding LacI/PurR family transcriptional regulator
MMRPPTKTRRPATLASLAAELGVSRTTVSNAYNRPDQLSAELRRRVLDTARRLGYPGPDPVARSLRTRQAGAVGLLLTESLTFAFEDPAARGFLEGLAWVCQEADRGLLLVPGSAGAEPAAVYRAAVDGFVVYSVCDDDPQLAAVLGRPVPAVVCDQPAVSGVDRVGIDERAAMGAVAGHVLELGHRRVGVLCLPLSREPTTGPATPTRQREAHSYVQRARLAGMRAAFEEAGLAWSNTPVIECTVNSVAAGRIGAARLLDQHQVTAIVCMTDLLALGVLAEAEQREDLRVPENLTVTGFDGIPEAERAGLTTVRQPFVEKGRTAGRLLLEEGNPSNPQTIILATELMVGRTSATPRPGGEEWFSGL